MKIDFGAACMDLFKTEKKWLTILLLSICVLIPVVGQMVIIGYLFRRNLGERAGIPATDFDFAHFGEHLKAGLWPTVCSLVASLVMIPLIMLAMVPMFLAPILAPENEVVIVTSILLGGLLYIVTLLSTVILIVPIQLRSGMMMDFKAGFSKTFVFDFLKKVGGSLLLWWFVLAVIMMPLAMIGYLALFVGVYVVIIWSQVTMMHLLFQHYDLYLSRGGTAIEINPELLAPLTQPVRPPSIPQQPPAIPPSV